MIDPGSDIIETGWPMVDGVHGGNICQESLCSADIAGSLLSSDVLLSGLETHSVAGVALVVLGDSDDSPGELSLVLVCAGDEGCGGTTVAHRNSESLRASDRDIGALFSGGLYLCEGEEVGRNDSADPVAVEDLVEFRVVADDTSLVRGLY